MKLIIREHRGYTPYMSRIRHTREARESQISSRNELDNKKKVQVGNDLKREKLIQRRLFKADEKVQVGNDQEKVQSERNKNYYRSKNRGGKY